MCRRAPRGDTAHLNDPLFPLPDATEPPVARVNAEPRGQRPNRTPRQWRPIDLEALRPPDHRARVGWDFVEGLDRRPRYHTIKAVEGHAGRSAIDPAILRARWRDATLDAVGRARARARLGEEHDAYRWIGGGVSVNDHTLADCRVDPAEGRDGLLTTSVAALMAAGLGALTRVAQDGGKIRASAGGAAVRGGERLAQCLAEATAQGGARREHLEADPGAGARREAAARRRAVEERQRRGAAAGAQVPGLEARRRKAGVQGPARRSTTDPAARVMTRAEGGLRPAFNAHLMPTTQGHVMVGVELTNAGPDQGQLHPMGAQVPRRDGGGPTEVLADGGDVDRDDLRAGAGAEPGGKGYAPPPGADEPTRAPRPLWRVDDALGGEWRQRMATAEATAVYRARAATSACVKARARNRGRRQLGVRGLSNARAVRLGCALAHTLMRAAGLRGAGAMAT